MASEIVKNLHGHTTIKLTNVHTGEEKVIEKDNTVTDYVDALLNSAWPTIHPLGFRARGMFPWFMGSHTEFIKDLTQGLMCFDKPVEPERDYNYLMPGDATCVACGGNKDYSGDVAEYGSYSVSESKLYDEVDGHYWEYVWNFDTKHGNGKINSICLTTSSGGRVGGGTLLWNGDLCRWAGEKEEENFPTFQIGKNEGMTDRSDDHLPYLPHPFSPDSLYNVVSDNNPGFSTFYPWYDLDKDELIITNQTCCTYDDDGDNSSYYIQKGDSWYSCGPGWNYSKNERYCNFFNSDWSGIQRPLTLWKYHTKPKYWNIYSSYYKSGNTNSAFDEMFTGEKRELYLPDDIKQDLEESYSSCRNQIEQASLPAGKYLSTTCYYANRIFASDNYLYQVFKPYTLNETNVILRWDMYEYIYVWKIPTDFSKDAEVIRVENIAGIPMLITDNYIKDQTSIFVTDEYLFCWDIDGNMWMYTFLGEQWDQIKKKDGTNCDYDIISGKRFFPQRTFYDYRSNILFIAGAGYSDGEDSNEYGTGGAVIIVKPLIKQAAILNVRGDYIIRTDYLVCNDKSRSYLDWCKQGCYTHLKTNNKKMIFNLARLTGVNRKDYYRPYSQPFICSYNYPNPILTTINNLPEEVEKTEDYTMKVTYRVSWSDPD